MCIPESAGLKILRAREVLTDLQTRVDKYVALEPFSVVYTTPPDNPGTHVFTFEVREPLPPFGLLVGDVVHCLRSALDQIAYALANRPERQIYFPISNSDPTKLTAKQRASWRDRLSIFPAEARQAIEDLQPFRGLGTEDPLWRIHELDRVDKHQLIPTVLPIVKLGVKYDPVQHATLPEDFRIAEGFLGYHPRDGSTIAIQIKGGLDLPAPPRFSGEIGFEWEGGHLVRISVVSALCDYMADEVQPKFARLFGQQLAQPTRPTSQILMRYGYDGPSAPAE